MPITRRDRRGYTDETDAVRVLLLGLEGVDVERLRSHVERQRREGIKSWIVMRSDPGVESLFLPLLTDAERLLVQAVYPPEQGGPTLLELCDRVSVALLGPSTTYREGRKVRRYSWREGLPIVDLDGVTEDEASGTAVQGVPPAGGAGP